jgi:hypothetical protein
VTQLRINASDLTSVHCAWGLRYWFRLHGLDFKDFLANGISAEAMLATNDQLAIDAVNRKRSAQEKLDGQQ